MGRLATMAQNHYERWLPEQYAQIEDRSEFFLNLEEEALNQIDTLADDLAGTGPPDEPFMDRVGRLRMARFNAEAQVIRELIASARRTVQGRSTSNRHARPVSSGKPSREGPGRNERAYPQDHAERR